MDIRDTIREIVTRYATPRYQGQKGTFTQFEALDQKSGEDIIINVLPKIIEDSPQLSRGFSQLSRAIRYLDHPHVARIIDVAKDKGVPYLVNAAIDEAKTLAAQLTSDPMDLERAGQLITQIGRALEYAGQKNVPHGSLTPDQVLLNERGETLVTGFGLASLAALLGTRDEDDDSPYLAPEQRLSDHAPTTRGDVYSLAAILFRLITGATPDLDTDPEKTLRADQLNEEIPPAVAALVAQAMSPDPLKRPQSADDFILAFRSALRTPRTAEEGERPLVEEPADGRDEPTWPAPLPFPEPTHIPVVDLSSLDVISQMSQETLKRTSELIPMPEHAESLELSEDDLIGFDIDSLGLAGADT